MIVRSRSRSARSAEETQLPCGNAPRGTARTEVRGIRSVSLVPKDPHPKNFSLLHMPDGSLRLTPLYDLMSTMIYEDDRLAMYIDDVQRMNRVTGKRLQNEAERWGLSRSDSRALIDDLLARIPDAAARATAETPDAPDSIARVIEEQTARLRTELS